MAGIYIHVPFCRKACHYCNFHFSTSLALKELFVSSLLKEISLVAPVNAGSGQQTNYLGNQAVDTVYFGGGTPSLLAIDELKRVMDQLYRHFNINNGAEITLEANPDDITHERLLQWKHAGINRLSIGVQSFFDEDLEWMNRAHHAADASHAILSAQEAGFHNITIDLIYGTPALSDEKWEHNVREAMRLRIPHVSCYALTVEPSTALEKMINQKKSADVDPDAQARQFLLLTEWMNAAGYEHYEISNFALPGMRSRHNSSYWQGAKYLGLGPSAHSFDGVSRKWNIANNALYIKAIQNNMLPVESETLTAVQKFNEYIMTSLRTIEGLSLEYLGNKFGTEEARQLQLSMQPFVESGRVSLHSNAYKLTREGMLHADGISASLFKEAGS